ncbi:hypothetical protein, partial [Pseudomonas prosekii]
MPSRIKDYLITVSAGLCLSTCVFATDLAVENYTLSSRSAHSQLEVQLEPAQWQWANKKSQLILGTSAPDYPPFDMTVSGRDYEGFTADYAGIISHVI